MMKSIRDTDIAGKKVVVRLDLDVPVEKGVVGDKTRLEAAIPTLDFLTKQGATIVILGHAGRPEGKVDESLSIRPMLDCLMEMLDDHFTYEVIDRPLSALDGTIFALENVRYHKGEESGDDDFAKYLAGFGDVYVNDAFAVSHRNNASIVGITNYLPGYAGLHLEKEIQQLETVMKNPAHPVVAVLGGAKVETKVPAINNMSQFADAILLGGKLVAEASQLELPGKVVLGELTDNGFDITEASARHFAEIISTANTIIWNGPMGKFEESPYDRGTRIVAEAVAQNSQAMRLTGGGDSIAALSKFNLEDGVGHISTGGGAMLEFLSGEPLPGLVALGYEL